VRQAASPVLKAVRSEDSRVRPDFQPVQMAEAEPGITVGVLKRSVIVLRVILVRFVEPHLHTQIQASETEQHEPGDVDEFSHRTCSPTQAVTIFGNSCRLTCGTDFFPKSRSLFLLFQSNIKVSYMKYTTISVILRHSNSGGHSMAPL